MRLQFNFNIRIRLHQNELCGLCCFLPLFLFWNMQNIRKMLSFCRFLPFCVNAATMLHSKQQKNNRFAHAISQNVYPGYLDEVSVSLKNHHHPSMSGHANEMLIKVFARYSPCEWQLLQLVWVSHSHSLIHSLTKHYAMTKSWKSNSILILCSSICMHKIQSPKYHSTAPWPLRA